MCGSLAGLHAMTGCNYFPALYRKGKKKPLQIILQNEEFQGVFINNAKKAFPCLNDLCAVLFFISLIYRIINKSYIALYEMLYILAGCMVKTTSILLTKSNRLYF
ncbi:unnamed protein product [Psylliodes chrysocephalus]|uniref:Uncharacterized protein n=1 Tax=Psylliodes chrysocephalus TaxID=3402493 RepID=A0A9P0CLK1_9CUCU|nr:unnamed protein product [Psylliodes chrysocephala]